jgi:hypothetical protein
MEATLLGEMSRLERVSRRALLAGDHAYLTVTDQCYYLRTYQCRADGDFCSIIRRFKRSEGDVVQWVASQLRGASPSEWLDEYTFIPVPSAEGFVRTGVSEALRAAGILDIRPALRQQVILPPSHLVRHRARQEYSFDETYGSPLPKAVVLFDDVLTSGSHFRAAKDVIQNRWNTRVIGLFICRTCSLWRRCGFGIQETEPRTPSLSDPRCHLFDAKWVRPNLTHDVTGSNNGFA